MEFDGFEALLVAAEMVLTVKNDPEPRPELSYEASSDSSTLTASRFFEGSSFKPWYCDTSGSTGNGEWLSDCTTLTAASQPIEMGSRNVSWTVSNESMENHPPLDSSARTVASAERTRAGVLISSNRNTSQRSSSSSGSSSVKRTRAGVMLSRSLIVADYSSRGTRESLVSKQLKWSTVDQRLKLDKSPNDPDSTSRAASRSRDSSPAKKPMRSTVDQRLEMITSPTVTDLVSRADSRSRGSSNSDLKLPKPRIVTDSTSRADSRSRGSSSSGLELPKPRIVTDLASRADSRSRGSSSSDVELPKPRIVTDSTSRADSRSRGSSSSGLELPKPRIVTDLASRADSRSRGSSSSDVELPKPRIVTDSTSRADSRPRGSSSSDLVLPTSRIVTDSTSRADSRPRGSSSSNLVLPTSRIVTDSTSRADSRPRGSSSSNLVLPKSRIVADSTSCAASRFSLLNSTPIRFTDPQVQPEISFGDLSVIRNDPDSNEFVVEDMYERFNATTILFEESDDEDEEEKQGDLGFEDTAPECVKTKQPNIRARNHEARVHGKQYTRADGTVVPARSVKPPCDCSFRRCYEKFDQLSRERILSRFLELNLSGQNQLLAAHMDIDITENPQVVNSRRMFTRKYHLPSNGGRVTVCKTMFEATFDIKDKKTRTIADKKLAGLGIAADDLRKNNSSHKTLSEEHMTFIKSHITSFPAYKSHYTSSKTEKLYLSSDLNIAKLYNLYLNKCKKKQFQPVHYNTYRIIFKQFKLSFRKPKMDTCCTCDKLAIRLKLSQSEAETAEILHEREVHQGKASAAYAEKRSDVQAAKGSSDIRTVSFDLQKCLATPYLQCGTAFYSRQLWTLNLTFFSTCNGTNETLCHLWDESKAKRGSQEIASCLLMDLNKMDKQIELVTYYSDRCGGQNLNYVVSSTFLHFVEQCRTEGRNIIIRHKFMTSGHSHMECDSIHASIEKAKKRCSVSIETPRDWAIFIATINRKVPFNVIEMEQDQFLALKQLKHVYKRPKKDNSKEKLRFKEICFFEYRSASPGLVFFKYSFDEVEYRSFRMAREGESMSLPGPIATEPLPLPPEKLEDLQKLMPFVTNKAYYETMLKNIVPKKRGRKPHVNVIDDFDGDLDDSVLFENEEEEDEGDK